jgi:hypothetical protein
LFVSVLDQHGHDRAVGRSRAAIPGLLFLYRAEPLIDVLVAPIDAPDRSVQISFRHWSLSKLSLLPGDLRDFGAQLIDRVLINACIDAFDDELVVRHRLELAENSLFFGALGLLVHRFLGTDHFRRIHMIHDGLYLGF